MRPGSCGDAKMAAIQRNAEIVDRRRGVPAAGTPECVHAKGNSV